MIQIEYELTEKELAATRQANGAVRVNNWQVWGAFIICCVPGLLIGIFSASMIVILLHVVVMITFLFLAIWGQTAADPYEQAPFTVTYDAQYRVETCGNSRHEGKLACFQSWYETDEFVAKVQFGLTHLEPKRAMTEDQLEQLRQYLKVIDNPVDFATVPPVPLYREIQARSDRQFVQRYQNNREDLGVQKHGRFHPISFEDNSGLQEVFGPVKSKWAMYFFLVWLAGCFLSLCVYHPETGIPLTSSCLLSTFLLVLCFRWLSKRALGKTQKLVNDEFFQRPLEFGLLTDGWYSGTPEGMFFHHWQDVDSFSVSRKSILIKTFNNAYLVPMRAFPTPEVAEQTIMAALRLHNESHRELDRSQGGVAAVESGNPFQAPRSDLPVTRPGSESRG